MCEQFNAPSTRLIPAFLADRDAEEEEKVAWHQGPEAKSTRVGPTGLIADADHCASDVESRASCDDSSIIERILRRDQGLLELR